MQNTPAQPRSTTTMPTPSTWVSWVARYSIRRQDSAPTP